MIKGKPIKNCKVCYLSEEQGIGSTRTEKNQTFLYFSAEKKRKEIHQINFSSIKFDWDELPSFFDLRFDNFCNLKCVICNTAASSAIEKDNIHNKWANSPPIVRTPNRFNNINNWTKSDSLLNELIEISPNAKWIQWAGGEPLINPIMMKYVRWLCDTNKASNICIHIISNFTIVPNELFELLSKFNRVILTLSIDAIGEIYEYVRFPGKWEMIEENVERLQQARRKLLKNIEIVVRITISSYGALNAVDILEWTKNNDFGISLDCLVQPTYCSPTFMPPKSQAKATQRMEKFRDENPHIDGFSYFLDVFKIHLKPINDISTDVYERKIQDFMLFTNDLDKSRKLNFCNTCPELYGDIVEYAGAWNKSCRFA